MTDVKWIDQEVIPWGETASDFDSQLVRIERAGRTCYKSRDKMNSDSTEKFIKNLMKRGHLSVLEHSSFLTDYDELKNPFGIETRGGFLTNFRAVVEAMHVRSLFELRQLYEKFNLASPYAETRRFTFEFVTDRSVSHELVRHRLMGISQESQRYCRYDKEIQLIHWEGINSLVEVEAINSYIDKIEEGYRPELARRVLPSSVATRIVMTTTLPDWIHFIELRGSNAAYPLVRELAQKVEAWFVEGGFL